MRSIQADVGRFMMAAVLSGVCCANGVVAQEKPVRLIAEGEEFKVEKGDWKVVPYGENYFASTFAITFLSRMACLGAPAQVAKGQEAVASQTIKVPYADSYHVAVRYEQPYNFSVEFTVEIEQGGKVVYRDVFGRLEDPKMWPMNKNKREPMVRYWWGATDNILWQMPSETDPGRMAKLSAGPAVIRLIAGPQLDNGQPRVMAAKRHVDVVCLTNDKKGLEAQKKTSYLELDGWLVQDGDLYVRFTNPARSTNSCLVSFKGSDQHSPYNVHVRDWPKISVLRDGQQVPVADYLIAGPHSGSVDPALLAPLLPLATNKVQKEAMQYLNPGETSKWVSLGQNIDSLNNSLWTPVAEYKGKVLKGYELQVEFAVPDGKGGLKSIKVARSNTNDGPFEIPGHVLADPTIRSAAEGLQWLNKKVAGFPKVGSVPKRLLIYNIMGFGSGLNYEDGRKLALALGDNTSVGSAGKTRLVAHWPPVLETLQKKEATGAMSNLLVVSYGDEMHLPPLKPDDATFAAWLKEKGVSYEGAVKYTTNQADELYYHSQMCATENGGKAYVASTAYLAERGILAGANYSPHANCMVSDVNWVRPFKMKALSMPWSEDYVWQIPEFSVQVVGYMTSAFRCGAKYHQMPIHMYVMPHSPGNIPGDFRLSFYTDIAHGAKMINYFSASPMCVGITENYVATDDLPMWKEIYTVSHEAGIFEDYVMDGTVRPARVGLLLSSVDELITGDANNRGGLHNQERKGVYYALRHAQVPVDFLTEDDVIDGLARDTRTIYVFQQYLSAKAVKALTDWARAGGTVVALCGGGFMDEFGKPDPLAAALYGVKEQSLWKDPALPMVLAKLDLPPYKPVDTVKWTAGGQSVQADVIGWKQTLVPADGTVIGTFGDGAPAVIEKVQGKGKAVLFGFFPAMAYLKSGLPLRAVDRGSSANAYAHFLPTGMDVSLRKALVEAYLPADTVRPVVCSVDLVEATVIDTVKPKKVMAVPLMNYSGKPVASMSVTIDGVPSVKAVRSVVHARVKYSCKDGRLVVTLPLDVADMILIDL